MEADAITIVDGVARGGRQMSPLLLPPVPLAADASVPGAQAHREEKADPLLHQKASIRGVEINSFLDTYVLVLRGVMSQQLLKAKIINFLKT